MQSVPVQVDLDGAAGAGAGVLGELDATQGLEQGALAHSLDAGGDDHRHLQFVEAAVFEA